MADAAGGGPKVDSKRRLAIGARRHEVKPSARAEDAGEQAGHDVAAMVFKGDRWHEEADIGAKQGDQRVEIGRASCRERV